MLLLGLTAYLVFPIPAPAQGRRRASAEVTDAIALRWHPVAPDRAGGPRYYYTAPEADRPPDRILLPHHHLSLVPSHRPCVVAELAARRLAYRRASPSVSTNLPEDAEGRVHRKSKFHGSGRGQPAVPAPDPASCCCWCSASPSLALVRSG